MISPHPDAIANALTRVLACIAYDPQDGHSLDDEVVELLIEVHQAARHLAAQTEAQGPGSLNIEDFRRWALRQALVRTGGDNVKVAALLGVNHATACRWRRAMADDPFAKPEPQPAGAPAIQLDSLTPAAYREMYRRHGNSHKTVAEYLGISETRMWHWRRKVGIPKEWEKEPMRQGDGALT